MIGSINFVLSKIKSKLLPLIILGFFIPITSVVAQPLALKFLINDGLSDKNISIVIISISVMLVSSMLNIILKYILKLKVQLASNYFLRDCVSNTVKGYYQLNYKKITLKGEGYYLSRVYEEPKEIAEKFIPLIVNTFKNCVTFIFGLGVALYISIKVTFVLLLVGPILLFLAKKYNKTIKDVVNVEAEKEANLRNIVAKSLQAFRTTLFYRLEQKVEKIVDKELLPFNDAAYDTTKTVSYFSMMSSSFIILSQELVIVFAAFAIFLGYLTIGGMMGYMEAYGRILKSVNSLSHSFPSFSKYQKYVERLEDLLKMPTQKKNHSLGKDIILKDFCFSYNGTPIFEKSNLSIKHKSNVLIEGNNGSGKTTLANIMAGFISIDRGKSILPPKGSVSGLIEPYNFLPGTVKQNLNFDNLSTENQNTVLTFLEKYKIKDKLGERVSELSYGQQKKIYIIMTMTSDADLYIYDEPLKGVDDGSRDYLFDDILTNAQNSTLIIISHDHFDKKHFNQIIDL